PAMRFIPVSDVPRSIAWYRDVLGFAVDEGGVEATLGPVRIVFGKEGYSPADWNLETARPPGSAIVFLQCSDVVATRSSLQVRRARPSEIENVNWIKMRMFEIRDPDGN